MKITPVMASLSAITGGTLGAGRVPLRYVARAYQEFLSDAVVTVTTGGVTIVAGPTLAALGGDIVVFEWKIKGTRNATAGTLTLTPSLSGTAGPVGVNDIAIAARAGITVNTNTTYEFHGLFLAVCERDGDISVSRVNGVMAGAGSTLVCQVGDSYSRLYLL